jgi:predicted component of type VI protein secretion system
MGSSSPPSRRLRPHTARLMIMEGEQDVDEVMLGSETLVGRGVTNDVVLPDRSIATRHARLLNDGDGYTLECLSDSALTALNGIRLPAHKPTALKDGDHIGLGDLTLRFVGGS